MRYEELTPKLEQIIFQKIQKDGVEKHTQTLNKLYGAFAVSTAKKYFYNLGLKDFDFCKGAAFMGLFKAAKKFNPYQEIRFISYAVFWILYEIRQEHYKLNTMCNYGAQLKKYGKNFSSLNKINKITNREFIEDLKGYDELEIIQATEKKDFANALNRIRKKSNLTNKEKKIFDFFNARGELWKVKEHEIESLQTSRQRLDQIRQNILLKINRSHQPSKYI